MPLTDLAIEKAKPTGKAYKLFDAGGMFALVSPTGSKLWRLKYRYAGKEKLLALGVYPEVSLADARIKRDEARKLLHDGIDPGVRRKLEKAYEADGAAKAMELIESLLAGRRPAPGLLRLTRGSRVAKLARSHEDQRSDRANTRR